MKVVFENIHAEKKSFQCGSITTTCSCMGYAAATGFELL